MPPTGKGKGNNRSIKENIPTKRHSWQTNFGRKGKKLLDI